MKKPRYIVLLDDPDKGPTEVDIEILYGDQLRAELEAPKHGLAKSGEAPLHTTALWVWAALCRLRGDLGPFQSFKDRILALQAVKEEDLEEVDPTQGRTESP